MEKLSQTTVNFTEKNIDRIATVFPNAVTETKDADGKLKRVVNFDQLKQLLSDEVIDGDECYEFTWVGKKQSIIEGNRPIRKTLRPCMEESKNWESTENLYIEGDNLEVLKLLQNSYLNKVKMIYIDPPYNTGNDFVYRDNFKVSKEDYEEELGLFDEEENRLFKNTETNGRYHSDWCSMMYPRLQLARNLLTDDGVIFISIDDNEVHNLRKICDEVFGEENFVANLIWTNKEGGGSSDSKMFRLKHEYILCYSRNIDNIEISGIPVGNENRYKLFDEYLETRGKYYLQKLGMGSIQYSESLDYPIEAPDGTRITPLDNNKGRKACWRWSKSKYEWGLVNGYIVIQKDRDDIWTVYSKQYLNCDNEGNIITRTQRPMGVIDEFSSTQASKLLYNMRLGDQFNYSKPIELIKYLIKRLPNNDFILDFFSGSATTAHAVMQLNAEDGGNRKFIMVQLPEETDPKSEYKNICEIGKERISRAGRKIEEELKAKSIGGELFEEKVTKKLDTGFRVLKVDSTNMKDVYYSPSQYNQQMLLDLESNIKDDRTDIDLLYGVLLNWGVPLSLPHNTEKIGGKDVHFVNDTDLVACFEENVPEEVIREIARRKPLRVVFRDSSFRNSPDKINVTEIFKTLSPETTIKVI
jgi:adenine-specific DNA-methyltransferase